jgi:hypothetical protein
MSGILNEISAGVDVPGFVVVSRYDDVTLTVLRLPEASNPWSDKNLSEDIEIESCDSCAAENGASNS